jgi:DNA-binding response OmpR family regulator/DNA-binding CsgD family transcriptional regulator
VVLVVDDHPDTLQFLIDALDNAGVTVLVATSGGQALEQVTRLLPDLILLDAVMPGMDGFATCRALKSGIAADVPVIFMTGLEETEHIVRGLEAGGIDYLTKPIAPDELLARMRVHLANAREAQGARTALDVSGRTMLAVDAQGNVKWTTPQAQRILATLAGRDTADAARGTATAAANDSIIVAAHDLRMRFCLLSRVSESEILLVIQQAAPVEVERDGISRLQNHFGLTSREAEVLYWLSRGKTNRDIAEILGISYRTAHKHLEHVYKKIGVESRSGAAAVSVRVLNP